VTAALAHEGIDTALVRPNPEAELTLKDYGLTLTARDEVITYVARNLEPYRGFHTLMRALPEIQNRRPSAHIIIVGAEAVSYSPSPPKGQTYKQKMLAEVGAQLDMRRIHLMGQVLYETLLRIYQISSVHVYLTYPFVLSWSLLEAMSAGCAVVASRTAPVEEIMTDGLNGHLVDFFDPAKLAARVDEVIETPNIEIRKQARRTVVERFDLQTICMPRQIELLGI
jgi:glycosyltransferase involved in cell wall biosynthesis